MSDITSMAPRGRGLRGEYAVYFAAVFTLALPVAAVAWVGRGLKGGNPVSRAWSQARVIAPRVFAA